MGNKALTQLGLWVDRAPEKSDSLRVSARAGYSGDQTLLKLDDCDIKNGNAADISRRILDEAEAWSDTEARECTFLCQFFDNSENVKSTFKFRLGPVDANAITLDGSPESMITQMQATMLEKDKILISVFRQQAEMWNSLIEKLLQRNLALESEKISVENLKEEITEAQFEILQNAPGDDKLKGLVDMATRLLEANLKAKSNS